MYWVDVLAKILFFAFMAYLVLSWTKSIHTLFAGNVDYATKTSAL